jgi:hypothetical protein
MEAAKEKIKQIYDALPHLNCGFCGFENCGKFAKAVAEGRASPFGCRQDPSAGYRISRIMGREIPAMGFNRIGPQGSFSARSGSPASLRSLRAEVDELSKRLDGILERMDSLGKDGSGKKRPIFAQGGEGRGRDNRGAGRGGTRSRRKRTP